MRAGPRPAAPRLEEHAPGRGARPRPEGHQARAAAARRRQRRHPGSSRAAGRIRLRLPRGRSAAARNRAHPTSPRSLRMRGAAPRRVRRRGAVGPIGRIGERVVAGRRARRAPARGRAHRRGAAPRGRAAADPFAAALAAASSTRAAQRSTPIRSGPARERPGRAGRRRFRSRPPAPARPARAGTAGRQQHRIEASAQPAPGLAQQTRPPSSRSLVVSPWEAVAPRPAPARPPLSVIPSGSLARLAQHAPRRGPVLARNGQRRGKAPMPPSIALICASSTVQAIPASRSSDAQERDPHRVRTRRHDLHLRWKTLDCAALAAQSTASLWCRLPCQGQATWMRSRPRSREPRSRAAGAPGGAEDALDALPARRRRPRGVQPPHRRADAEPGRARSRNWRRTSSPPAASGSGRC